MSKIKLDEKRLARFILSASKMKIIIHKNPHIEDRELSRQLGISFNELQEIKHFCIMNKVAVNRPLLNKAVKDKRVLE